MKRFFLPLILLLAALMGVSCSKSDDGPIELFVEPFSGDTKLAVDGTTATWSNDDLLRVNGGTAVVVRNGSHAYISNELIGDDNRALFPASLYDGSLGSNQITITLPQEYHYSCTSSGTQLLDIPLAARSTDNEQLHFCHLTGAIAVKIKNTRNHPLVIDHITLTSSGYQLSGSRGINFEHIDTIGPIATADESKRTLIMRFDREALTLASGASRTVLLPVLPVGGDNVFTIVVSGHNEGRRYTYSRTQNGANTHALDRNVIGYATTDLSGDVTIKSLFDGRGNVNEPYLIKTASDFKLMAEAISKQWQYGGDYDKKYYQLEADIDMSGIEIDAITNYSTGIFDGNGHMVSNIVIRSVTVSEGYTYCGLFAQLSDNKVKRLRLRNVSMQHNGNVENINFGAICGGITGTGSIENCQVDGLTVSVNATTSNPVGIGGIVGLCRNATTIPNCSSIGGISVTSSNCDVWCGAIVGRFYSPNNTLTLNSCTLNGSISANTNGKTLYAGGLVGGLKYDETLMANKCQANGSIVATASASSKLGRYVGYAQASQAYVSFTECSGTVSLTLNGVSQTVKDVGNK